MQPGTVLGAYRIANKIGAGGMGQVFIAEHTMLGRRAALKVLHPEMSAREDIVRRFFNEARAATAIPDPGIVQIFDFGYSEEGAAYIVMELLDGETLETRVQRGRLELRQAMRLMRQAASTLGAAHARGIVHRDLKPDNIFIMKDPEVAGGERAKILDFGIAKLSDDRRTAAFNIADVLAPRSSHGSGVLGTPLYMSPEQCRGQAVDARSDVYALGCVLYQILTGQYAFDAETPEALVFKHCDGPIPMPSMAAPNIPVAIDEVVRRCLAKRPHERFRSGTELALALAEAINATPEPAYPRAETGYPPAEMGYPRAESPAIPNTLRGLGSQPSIDELPTVAMLGGLDMGMAPTIPGQLDAPAVPGAYNKKMTTLSRATGSSSVGQAPRSRSLAIVLATCVAAVVVGIVGWKVATSGSKVETSAATAPADPTPTPTAAPDPIPRPGAPDPTTGAPDPTTGAEPAKTAAEPATTGETTPAAKTAATGETTPAAKTATGETAPTAETATGEPTSLAETTKPDPKAETTKAETKVETTKVGTTKGTTSKDSGGTSKKTNVTQKTKHVVVKKKQPPPPPPPDKSGTKTGAPAIQLDANGIPVHR
jgi:serine/threonine protein kinase